MDSGSVSALDVRNDKRLAKDVILDREIARSDPGSMFKQRGRECLSEESC